MTTPITGQVPAIEGWFVHPEGEETEPALLGTRCTDCGTYFFPPEHTLCRNPACTSTQLEQVQLSRRGKVWSFSVNHYAAPAPYVGKEPFEPYTVVAVELATEQIVVLGQLAEGCDPAALDVGDEVEVTLEPLFTDPDGNEHIVWKWRPL